MLFSIPYLEMKLTGVPCDMASRTPLVNFISTQINLNLIFYEDLFATFNLYIILHFMLNIFQLFFFQIQMLLLKYMFNFQISGDIEESICHYREKMFALKQTVQPYILIEGPSLQDIKSVYVVIDKIRYQTDSILKAIDLTYKIFHVANAAYPAQSEYLWLLIQKSLYKVSTSQDKVIPYILDTIENLHQM